MATEQSGPTGRNGTGEKPGAVCNRPERLTGRGGGQPPTLTGADAFAEPVSPRLAPKLAPPGLPGLIPSPRPLRALSNPANRFPAGPALPRPGFIPGSRREEPDETPGPDRKPPAVGWRGRPATIATTKLRSNRSASRTLCLGRAPVQAASVPLSGPLASPPQQLRRPSLFPGLLTRPRLYAPPGNGPSVAAGPRPGRSAPPETAPSPPFRPPAPNRPPPGSRPC
jgi:hypothetical protein